MAASANIPRLIKALQESEDNPSAAVQSLEREAAEHEAEAKALRQAVVAIKLMTGQTPTASQDEPPAGMEAIRRIMREGGVWTARAMFDELKKRGWDSKKAKNPLATVEAAMDRMYRVKGEIERVGRGEYSYKGFPASPAMLELS